MEDEEFGRLVTLLASATPDIYGTQRRQNCMEEATKALQESEDCRDYLASASCEDLTCSSKHAYRRTIPLVLVALSQYSTVEDAAATPEQQAVVKQLSRLACRLLNSAFSTRTSSKNKCMLEMEYQEKWKPLLRQTISKKAAKKALGEEGAAATATATATPVAPTITTNSVVVQALFHLASTDDTHLWSAAIPLGFDLCQNNHDWAAVFIRQAFGGSSLPKQDDMEGLMAPFLDHTFQQHKGAWPQDWLDTLLLKVKANPEGGLECLLGFCNVVVNTKNTSASTSMAQLPWQTHEEYLTVLGKQLQSSKDNVRDMAGQILACAPYHVESMVSKVLPSLLTGGGPASTTKAASMTTPQRVSLYQLFTQLALGLLLPDNDSVSQHFPIANLDKPAADILTALTNLLGKEGKTATASREECMTALWYWWRIAKKNNPNDSGKNLEPVMGLLRKPLSTKNGADTCAIVGHFLKTIVDPDAIEAMVMDLLGGKNAALDKGLDGIITAAMTACTAKKPTASVEGLIVVYLGLVYAMAVGGSAPAYLVKAWKASPNFVWSAPMLDGVTSSNSTTSSLIRFLLPRVMALAAKWTASDDVDAPFKSGPVARALSACTTRPYCEKTEIDLFLEGRRRQGKATKSKLSPSPCASTAASVKTVLTYQPKVALDLTGTLWGHVNERANESKELIQAYNIVQQAREDEATATSSSDSAASWRIDSNAVRRVAYQPLSAVLASSGNSSPKTLAQILTMMHVGSSLKGDGHQRNNLRRTTLDVLKASTLCFDDATFAPSVATFVAQIASSSSFTWNDAGSKDSAPFQISDVIHRAALSLLVSLGGIGGKYLADLEMGVFEEQDDSEKDEAGMKASEFASTLCTKEIPIRLKEFLISARDQVESLSAEEVDLMLSPVGTLHGKRIGVDDEDAAATRGGSKGKKSRGGFNAREEEEWEAQLKKELAEKKKKEQAASGQNSRPVALSPEEKKKVAQQDEERERLSGFVYGDFLRALSATHKLTESDIEIGNACLPMFSDVVLSTAVSKCPAFSAIRDLNVMAFTTLTALAGAAYEIPEDYAAQIATALTISCRSKGTTKGKGDDDSSITVSALPNPCSSAACAIGEMEQSQGAFTGNSFVFLFPILQAALMGPRTTQGCEGALRILEWHTSLLVGDEADPVVAPLRKNMAVTVLELMQHDRAQTFSNPSPSETLVACFRADSDAGGGPTLVTAELAPLLDDRGALGGKVCRAGAMLALRHIALDHAGLIKKNPLIENRIWLNCFDENDNVRIEARRAWKAVHGEGTAEPAADEDHSKISEPPSLMYAAPLLPLLSNSDKAIARAASDAYARGMAMQPTSVSKNIQKLCNSYIEVYPSSASASSKKTEAAFPPSLSKKVVAAPPKKKPISLGLPKKKTTVKNSALGIAGIGKAKPKKKSSALSSALLKPKQERTLESTELASQFQTGPVQTTKEESKDSPEKVTIRLGILQAITALTAATDLEMDIPTLKTLTSFLMAYGIAEIDETVKTSARNALRDVVASNGGSDEAIAFLLPHLEDVLKKGAISDEAALSSLSTEKVPRDVDASDRRKEGAVVALGSVALHLKGPENASKIDTTIDMLIATLKTPSEDVQSSVAECLAKLMKKGNTQARIESILDALLKECLQGDDLACRRGAAYGLSAAVKGSGIATLKKFEIVKQLEEACANGESNSKEGSLFAIELLSVRLGLLFEPYVIVLLPSLLKAFSDSSDYVRQAAQDTCGLIMSKLSAHGVKLVMPAVLTAFNDPAWRTKEASIRMLGAMSHLAPKQLASALPKVVPKLTEAFGDTHPRVKASAEAALDEISTVVRNPEISSISQLLLKALTDPADNTTRALEGLIETEFLHAIDAPSLALIVPILHRGLRDRGATTKRYGALIAGNICTMINDARDFVPYLPLLLPDLKAALLDPIPDVRGTSARALGSLTRGLGDNIVNDLRPWLIERLGAPECSSAERSGAANGLTEVLVAAGTDVIEDVVVNEILPLQHYPEASKREGVLWMLSFLAPALGVGFSFDWGFVPALIAGLADDAEAVREVAMRAGKVLIRSHGKHHHDQILPSLEDGLSSPDYRIRLASLTLMGDLLSTIGGTTLVVGDGDTREDARKAERAQAQIALTLGDEKRKHVFSGLYLARSDNTSVVRHHAIQVWKTVVPVTGRALKEILQVLVGLVVTGLASGDAERTLVSGQCLGEVVTKLGDTVLPQIIPVLRNSLYEGDSNTKRGVCVGLTEVIKSSTKDQILRFIEIIVKVVQDALCDEDEEVCSMAAASFQSLYAVVGNRALDEVVPSLMVALESSDDEVARTRALNGLTGIMRVRSKDLLPYIVPRLLQRPVTKNHAEALAGIAKVTGETIHLHFHSIIPVFLGELASFHAPAQDETDKEREDAIRACCEALCGSVQDEGVSTLVSEIASKCGHETPAMRIGCCWLLQTALTERAAAADIYEFVPTIMRELVYRLNDEDGDVLKAGHKAWTALSKHVPAEESVKHIEFMRNLINSMVSESRRRKGGVGDGEFYLPGFNIPKGLEPMLPIYQRGILYGSATIREVSAAGLGEVIMLTSNKFLAGPVIIKMTGPLLRVVGDRNPSNVKIAILRTLGLILVKGGPALRAFVPQFQTTFVKALSDPSRQVRVEAIKALSLLMPLSTRVDPLIKELVAGSLGKNAAAATEGGGGPIAAVQTATLEALAAVLEKGGKKAKLPDSIQSAFDASKELLENEDESVREGAAKVMGAAVELLDPSIATNVLQDSLLINHGEDSGSIKHGKACAVRKIFASSIGKDIDQSLTKTALQNVLLYMNDDKGTVKEAGCVAWGAIVGRSADPKAALSQLEPVLMEIMGNNRAPLEIHRAVAAGFCILLELVDHSDKDNVGFLGKTLMDGVLEVAMSDSKRVQTAFHDVLWLALDVENGTAGLDKYAGIAQFENVKSMRSLHSKVLTRITEITLLQEY